MAENGEHDTEEDYSFQDDGEGNEQLDNFVGETEGDDNVQDQDNNEPERRVERTVSTASDGVDDPELEAIKVRVREMEEEAEKLKEMQTEVEKQMNLSSSSIGSPPGFPTMEEKVDADAKSIYVGNVDYGATAQELEAHFHGCGSINRVTILCDKFSGHPKGFAYIEFADRDSVQTATALDESLFRGRQIKVCAKRTNRPGVSSTDRAPRGRSRRPRTSYYYGYTPRSRGRYRGRRASWYSPY